MWICSCNPFNDKTLDQCLKNAGDTTVRMADVYKCCSGGAKPQCNSCLPAVKDKVQEHNARVAVERLKDSLSGGKIQAAQESTETASQ